MNSAANTKKQESKVAQADSVYDNKSFPLNMDQLLNKTRLGIYQARAIGLGLMDKANSQAKTYFDNVKLRSDDKLEENRGGFEERETPTAFAKLAEKVEQRLVEAQTYGKAAYDEANVNAQKLKTWLNDAVEESRIEPDDHKFVSRVGRSFEHANEVFNLLLSDTRQTIEELLEEAKESGKDLDFELRKTLIGNQSVIEERIQKFWRAIGLVNKQEMEEVNRKLVLLAESLENQLDEESKNLVYLNRRKHDRRIKQVPVEFDKRLRCRRAGDRLAS
ncbi:MAG: hypothetical protein MI976_25990 [Pseudomonadales bacterium]|nr:hypothetical protein [Pseudomonadales bacterium]